MTSAQQKAPADDADSLTDVGCRCVQRPAQRLVIQPSRQDQFDDAAPPFTGASN